MNPIASPAGLREGNALAILRRGLVVAGRVVDAGNGPIHRARVLLGDRFIVSSRETTTDEAGRFRIENAQPGEFRLTIQAAGHSPAIKTVLVQAGLAPIEIRLEPGHTIRGRVIDRQGKPVAGAIAPFSGNDQHLIRIEARGYKPAVSPVYRRENGEQVFNARLVNGPWLEGAVREPTGRLMEGAEVILVTGRGISIGGGKSYHREFHPHELTGTNGRFSFSPPIGDFRIVALHDQGYAEGSGRQFEPTHELIVQPWGGVEGTLKVGGKPLANQPVEAHMDDQRVDPEYPIIQNESRALTDQNRHFFIDRLAPGEARVHWQPDPLTMAKPPDRYYQAPFVVVESGQTAHVEIVQEGGRTLIGRLAVPDDNDLPMATATWNAFLASKLPEPPYPADLPTGSRRAWLNRWRLTEAATRYRRLQRGFGHSLKLNPDHSFRVDEIQPGRYELHVQVRGSVQGRDQEIASLTHELGVAPPLSSTSGPVDLGTLTVIRKDPE